MNKLGISTCLLNFEIILAVKQKPLTDLGMLQPQTYYASPNM